MASIGWLMECLAIVEKRAARLLIIAPAVLSTALNRVIDCCNTMLLDIYELLL